MIQPKPDEFTEDTEVEGEQGTTTFPTGPPEED
jgi:hypothetical protein